MATLRVAIDARDARRGADEFEGSTRRMTTAANRTARDVRNFQSQTDRAGKSAGVLGLRLRTLVGGFTALAVARRAFATIRDFEQSMANLAGVTRASAAELAAFEDAARGLGATTRFTATEAAEGLLFLSRAGFDTNESVAAIESTLNLASAGMISLGEAADFASNIVSQFNLSAEETSRVVDTLVAVSNRSNTNVRQLAEALKFAGPVAGSLGLTVEETAAAIGSLGDQGIQASLAGTNLRGIMLALTAPTDGARKVLADMGLTLQDVDTSTESLITVFERLTPQLLDSGRAAQIFGRRNTGAALTLSRTTGRLRELQRAALEAEDEARNLARVQENTLGGSVRALNSAFDELLLTIGDSGVGSAFRSLVDGATDLTRALARTGQELGLVEDRIQRVVDAGLGEGGQKGFKSLEDELQRFLEIQNLLRSPLPILRQRGITSLEDLGIDVGDTEGEFGLTPTLTRVKQAIEDLTIARDDLREAVEKQTKAEEDARIAALFTDNAATRAIARAHEERELIRLTNAERRIEIKLREVEADLIDEGFQKRDGLLDRLREELELNERIREQTANRNREQRSLAQQTERFSDTMTSAAQQAADAFGDVALGARSANEAVSSLIQSVIRQALSSAFQQAIASLRQLGLGGGGSVNIQGQSVPLSSFDFDPDFNPSFQSGPVQNARGNAFVDGSLARLQRGGLVTRPTLFGLASGGRALGGELGTEGVLPLGRTRSGDLGVKVADRGDDSSRPVFVSQTFNVRDADSFRKSKRQIALDMRRELRSL